MKREKSIIENRRNRILEIMKESPEVRVDELAEMFGISRITIRRDLQALEDQNLLVRFYGGAVTKKSDQEEGQDELSICRSRIARYAAGLVEDGDSLFINTSMTALMVLEYVKNKEDVTVITNNGKAISTEHSPGVSVILTGGELRYPKEAMVGDFALRNLQTVYAKKSFIGCSGFSAECGMTTETANEVNINQLMIEHATVTNYILADHTKIGKNSSFISCSASSVVNLITDDLAPEEELQALREKGMIIHQVRRA